MTIRAKRRVVAILSDSALDEYQNTVLFGAADELRARGLSVVFFCGGVVDSPDRSSAQRNWLYELVHPRRIDGVIVLSPLANHIGSEALSAWCSRFAPLPVCALAAALPGRPSVLVDDAAGMRGLLEHFLTVHRRRRVAFVRGPLGNEEAERRHRVYLEMLERHGLPYAPELVTIGDFNSPSGADAVRALCDEKRTSFDALVAANDLMALGAMEALQARGIEVPRQVAVAGFDDIEEARFASPPLTTVRQPLYDSGRQAAGTIAAMLDGRNVAARTVLETTLVVRESCGCAVDRTVSTEIRPAATRAPSVAAYVAMQRSDWLERLARAVSPEHARIPSDWVEPLYEAFLSDVRGDAGDQVVAVLAETLRRVVAAGGAIRPWHSVVSVIGRAATAALDDEAGTVRVNEVIDRARVLIGDVRERVQARHRIRRERWIRTLHETSEALMASFGEQALVGAIGRQLPRLRIPACAMFVYERSADGLPAGRARPLFVYDEARPGGAGAANGDGTAFDPRDLAPSEWLDGRAHTLVAEPLVSHGEALGVALFEVGPQEGAVYEGLRELVSSALKGARLVEQVVDEATRRQRAERERLEKEMEIAARIQTTMVPKSFAVPGLDVAAAMIPASEVGGDYYDVRPFDGGCWFGIGDVAGHGLRTGLVMLMIQSVVAALVERDPRASPSSIYAVLNAVLYDNVHRRMGHDEHATLSLLRYDGDGHLVCAGAHEDIVIYRASSGTCHRLETRGPWVGAFPRVGAMLVDMTFALEVGDVMVLLTDGVTEGRDERRVQFGPERVCAVVERAANEAAESIRDHIVAAVQSWTVVQDDDVSLVVVRRTR